MLDLFPKFSILHFCFSNCFISFSFFCYICSHKSNYNSSDELKWSNLIAVQQFSIPFFSLSFLLNQKQMENQTSNVGRKLSFACQSFITIMLYLQPILVNATYVHTDVARTEPHNLLLPEIFCPISL